MEIENQDPILKTNEHTNPISGGSSIVLVMAFLMGTYFGIVLTKSEVVRWQRVHDMFLFNEPHMYLIIGVGVAVAMVSMFVLKSINAKAIDGQPIRYKPKPFHRGVIFGGSIFGAGWAIAGACPGPIYAQIGGGLAALGGTPTLRRLVITDNT